MLLRVRRMKYWFGLCCWGLFFVSAELSFARQILPIKGEWDSTGRTLSFEMGGGQKGPFHFELKRSSDAAYDLILTVSNWKVEDFSLSTVLTGSLKVAGSADAEDLSLEGRVASKYTLLNRRPFEEGEADFVIERDGIVIRSLRLGNMLIVGRAGLGPQPDVDFTVLLDGVPLAEIVGLIYKDAEMGASGVVTGEMRLQGPADKIHIRGKVRSYNGDVGGHAYHSVQINFSGIYPLIYVDNSYISQADGLSFEVQGALDLSDLKYFKEQLEGFMRFPLITQRGKTLEWTFKRMQSDQRSGTTELKYMIQRNENFNRDIDLFGVQRRLEF